MQSPTVSAGVAGFKVSEVTSRSQQDSEIRSSELAHHGKVDSYNLALTIEKRTPRATRSGLGIIDNLVRRHVADVSLSADRPEVISLLTEGSKSPRSSGYWVRLRLNSGEDSIVELPERREPVSRAA